MPGGKVVVSRTMVRLVLACLLVLGVLGMHGFVSVGDHGVVPGALDKTESVGAVLDDARHAGGTDGHTAIHLAEACLWMLVAGIGAVGLVFVAWSVAGARRTIVSRSVQALRVRFLPGPAPPPGWSHLELAVILR